MLVGHVSSQLLHQGYKHVMHIPWIFIFTQDDQMHQAETKDPRLITSDKGLHEVLVVVCTVQHLLSNFHAELLLLLCQHLGHEFHQYSLHAQTLF